MPQPLRRLRRHLPMNAKPLRRLRRHLPINGEEPFLHLNAAAPPAPSAPPPHEWGGAFLYLLNGGEPGCPSLLVGRDFWVVAFHQGDLVETFQQAITREWVDLEAIAESVAPHLLRLEVDRDLRCRIFRHQVDQVPDLALGQRHREQPGLVAVGSKDVCEAWRGDRTEDKFELDPRY